MYLEVTAFIIPFTSAS